MYRDAGGGPIRDRATLARIRALAIPPAWCDVWICPDPSGHLQAVGTDAAGRRQYRYHDRWRQRRDAQKFDRMISFAAELPTIRARVGDHLGLEGMPRERVLACAVRLLDRASFRVGSEPYARDNGSFGLATLRRDHVHVRGQTVRFDFTAKGGQRRVQEPTTPSSSPSSGPSPGAVEAAPSCSRIATVAGGAICAHRTSTPTSRSWVATASARRTSEPGTEPWWPRSPWRSQRGSGQA